jgi:hypothetical protein
MTSLSLSLDLCLSLSLSLFFSLSLLSVSLCLSLSFSLSPSSLSLSLCLSLSLSLCLSVSLSVCLSLCLSLPLFVSQIFSKQVRNAFCAVRPPGHHAGPCGLMSGPDAGAGAESHGFCLLNNVSIGAAYAMNVYRSEVKRVAIVDFDVHHGNGTEETVRWLNPGLTTVDVLGSNVFGQLHTPRYKPWFDVDDSKNVLFVSVHGYGPRERGLERFMPAAAFYPGTGKTSSLRSVLTSASRPSAATKTTDLPASGSEGVALEPMEGQGEAEIADPEEGQEDADEGEDASGLEDSEDDSSFNNEEEADDEPEESAALREQVMRSRLTTTPYSRLLKTYESPAHSASVTESYAPPLVLDIGVTFASEEMVQGEYRHQWRNYFRDIIFPKLMDFGPDCLFISAGFDAHKKDLINSGYISLVSRPLSLSVPLSHLCSSSPLPL